MKYKVTEAITQPYGQDILQTLIPAGTIINLELVEEVSHTNMGHEFIKGLNSIEEVKVKAFVPKIGEEYWCVDLDTLSVAWYTYNNHQEDKTNMNMGNCFRTKEDAQIAQAKVIELFNSFK